MSNSRYRVNKTKYLNDLEQEELTKVLKRSIEGSPAERRDSTLLFLLLFTGARATEILNVSCSDLDASSQSVFVKGIKGSDDREIPLPSWLFRLVREQAAGMSGTGGRLFPISYNRLRQIWQLYRPIPKKLHALRHTFAINLYKRSKDLRLVQVALGHRNISNTMVYADYIYSQQELRKLLVA